MRGTNESFFKTKAGEGKSKHSVIRCQSNQCGQMMRRKRGESASPAPVAWKGEEEARGGRGDFGKDSWVVCDAGTYVQLA